MNRIKSILFFYFLSCTICFAQTNDGFVVPAKIIDGDTVPMLDLDEIIVLIPAPASNISNLNVKKYTKLIRDVKKTYPYAVIAEIKLNEYGEILSKITDENKKKKLMKEAEEEIKKKFTKDIEEMTFSQGKILIKLIYRQTGKTSYTIVKELRGNLRAFFWQTIARVFGANLKEEYDPTGKDKAIEEIVLQIENGTI
ncbi:MAG: DUF4294 domain-containing protein [Bacteroidetes bacterium]|nr:DUF4294 domain-containing protein [Bacteroidota bacterium]